MKTIHYISLAIMMAAVSSCCMNTLDSVYGSGDVISEERTIEDFNELKVSSGIDVLIRQGEKASLMLEADENLHQVIRTEVIDNTLKIYTDKRVLRSRSMKVYLVYVDLNSIRVNSAGDVKGENTLQTDNLNLDVSSAGDLELDIKADEIDIDISSSGDVRLSGTCDILKADLSSAGDLHAYDLICNKCKVSCSSAGDARINAREELDLRSSSAGSIYYRGDARIVNSNISSAGSIVKK